MGWRLHVGPEYRAWRAYLSNPSRCYAATAAAAVGDYGEMCRLEIAAAKARPRSRRPQRLIAAL